MMMTMLRIICLTDCVFQYLLCSIDFLCLLTVWVEQIDSLIFLSELQGTFAVWKLVEKLNSLSLSFSPSLLHRETQCAVLPVNGFLHDYALFSTPLIPIFVFRTMQHKMYFIFSSSQLHLNTTDKLDALPFIHSKML